MEFKTLTNRVLLGEFPLEITVEDFKDCKVLTFNPGIYLTLFQDINTKAYIVRISSAEIDNVYVGAKVLFNV